MKKEYKGIPTETCEDCGFLECICEEEDDDDFE